MRIAVIGRGRVGQAIGEGWRRAGHDVVYGSRHPRAADESEVAEAAASAGVVALATPWDAVPSVLVATGGFPDRTVIDCGNPLALDGGRLRLAVPNGRSGAEFIADRAPQAFVFKTLNQTGAENMADARRFTQPPAMFVAGDDPDRKRMVLALVADLGFEPLDAGPIANAGLLEALAMLWIDQALVHGQGRDFVLARIRAS